MKKIFFILTILATLFSTKGFAAAPDMHDITYQQTFFYTIEALLEIGGSPSLLDLNDFVAAKVALQEVDKARRSDTNNYKQAIGKAIYALNMAQKTMCIKISESNTPENHALFQDAYDNLKWISDKLSKKFEKISAQELRGAQKLATQPAPAQAMDVQKPTLIITDWDMSDTPKAATVWKNIDENILGECFRGYIIAINENMQKHVADKNKREAFDKTIRILDVMESNIKAVIVAHHQPVYLQILRNIRISVGC